MGFSDKSYDFIISALSGGEKTRLALAKLLLEAPDLLILDEPTNHLDFRTLSWLEEYLQSYRGGLLIVSHDRYFLDKMVTKIWDVENKTIVPYKGNYSKYKILREERITRLEKEYQQQQAEIAALQEYVDRNIARASTAASARSRVHKLEAMDRIERPYLDKRRPYFQFTYQREPVKDVLIAEHLKLNVGIGEEKQTLFEDVNLHLRRAEKVAIIGENGVGKSTLLKSLIGQLRQPGEIDWGRNVTVGYYDQENQNLDPNKTVLQELWERYPTMPEFEVRKILGSVLITDDNVYKKVGVISGGEKAKLGLALLMTEHNNTLLLDEPTNHLDLQSKEALEEGLQEFTGTLLFVSHDRYFLNAVPTRIIELCAVKGDPSSQQINIYDGNYDFYLEQKAIAQQKEAEEKALQAAAPVEKEGAKIYYRSKEQRREDTKKRTRLRNLEQSLEQLDDDIAAVEQSIADPANANDFTLLTEQCSRLEALKQLHDQTMEEWLILAEEVEQINQRS
jgi:ATP-binding cassette subfamily F protein 3